MIEAGRVELTPRERQFLAFAISDAFTPLGRDLNMEDAARLIEARIAVLLAARGERGYHEGWGARSEGDDSAPLEFDPPTFDYQPNEES